MAADHDDGRGSGAAGTLTPAGAAADRPAPVSVVIVNHNAGRLLADCLDAALAQAAEVILVDNASAIGPFEVVAARFATNDRLRIVRSRVNTGFAAGCNRGAALATQPAVLFLNPDCILAPRSVATLLGELSAGERVGMVGGLLTDAGGREQGGARRSVPTPWRAFVRGFGLGRLAWLAPRLLSDFCLHREPLPERPVEVEAISGALTLVSREAFDDAGPWDEGFFLHCEDLDLCVRFRAAGWRILFVPDAVAVHHRGMCGRSRPLAVEWHKHRGMIRFYRKHFRQSYPAGLFGLVVAGVWLRFVAVAARLSAAAVGRGLSGGAVLEPQALAAAARSRVAASPTLPT